jgi:hypothetical protein
MIERLALAAGAVFLVGIALSVLIAELLRRRDAREAAQRAAALHKMAARQHRSARRPPPAELTPAAAAELAIQSRQAALAKPLVRAPHTGR